jgi:hypothetical protein
MGAERVDLDDVQANLEQVRRPDVYTNSKRLQELEAAIPTALAVVAELQVARKAVEAARVLGEALRSGGPWSTELARLLVAIEVYDQAGGS